MGAAPGDDLLDGTRALERADWEAARCAFERVLEGTEVPDAYEGLGLAQWFLGKVQAGIAARERAFEGYIRAERCDDAAPIAVWVSHQHLVGGRASAARGWLARAEHALEGIGGCAGHGWVAVERARHAANVIGDHLAEWTRDGYRGHRTLPAEGTATVITPRSTIAALRAGYPVQIDAGAHC